MVVRVRVPAAAQFLLTLPLEIARVDGAPLAGVSFVFQAADETLPAVEPIGDRLRLLALFSVPPDGNALNLRREAPDAEPIGGRSLPARPAGRWDLRVLGYGVTRDSRTGAWRKPRAGTWHPLLRPRPAGARWRWKSRTGTTDQCLRRPRGDAGRSVARGETGGAVGLPVGGGEHRASLRWLGLDPASAPSRDTSAPGSAQVAPTVAQALTESLGCAVVAMRYAVEDEFASNFGRALYEQLFENGNALPEAARLALLHTAGPAGALSGAAASLFGARAAELKLAPPDGDGSI